LSSNEALVKVLRDAVESAGLPANAIQLVPGAGHEAAKHLMRARGLVDVLIPRGGANLIRSVVEESTVPVIETGVGNCHVYVDADADFDTALSILLNAKVSRPSVCNAAETLLVHADVADAFLPLALAALHTEGVTVHGDARVARVDPAVVPAPDDDWDAEYLSRYIAAAVVPSLSQFRATTATMGSRSPIPTAVSAVAGRSSLTSRNAGSACVRMSTRSGADAPRISRLAASRTVQTSASRAAICACSSAAGVSKRLTPTP